PALPPASPCSHHCCAHRPAPPAFPTRRSSDLRQGAHRDLDHEEEVLAEAMTLWPLAGTDAPDLLTGTDTAHFTEHVLDALAALEDRKSTRLNSSHVKSSYAVFCLKKKMAGDTA